MNKIISLAIVVAASGLAFVPATPAHAQQGYYTPDANGAAYYQRQNDEGYRQLQQMRYSSGSGWYQNGGYGWDGDPMRYRQTSVGRTKYKDGVRMQFCDGNIGWVPYGVSCLRQR